MTQNMPQKQKTKLVPVSREPALLTERDAGKSPVLECIDLGITFGGLKAVDNFNVTIGRTEITGLIGPNGAGKTTVFNLLTKVYQPTHGTILLNGKDIHDLNTAQVNRAGSHVRSRTSPVRRAERGRKHHRRDGHADALHDARGHFPSAPLLEGRARHA